MTSHRLDKWTVREMLGDLKLAEHGLNALNRANPGYEGSIKLIQEYLGKIRDTILSASLVDIEIETDELARRDVERPAGVNGAAG
jgi:hypothetical protein